MEEQMRGQMTQEQNQAQVSESENPLGTKPVAGLLFRFAVPSVISMLVSSLYNIVDQFFIGRSVGELGNAATNICFPLTILCIAAALFFGIGGAAAFNISMGRGEEDEAVYYLGNAAVLIVLSGLMLTCVTQVFLQPMLLFFGSPEDVLAYAKTYTRIVSLGFPCLIMISGGGHLMRADGRPGMSMACNLAGAAVNVVLDALFVFVLQLGMAGAAAATIIGQYISAGMIIWFLVHCRTVRICRRHLRLRKAVIARIASLGIASGSNQIAMMVVQIVMNKSLKYYGAQSIYGEAIPIACAGIITKINQVYLSFVIGTSQGMQPITSFNFGAGKHKRVRSAYLCTAATGFAMSLVAFALFQLVPDRIIALFGDGSEEYVAFAVHYFRIYLFFTFLNFLQPISSTFLNSIGKPKQGIFLSLTRQILFLLPLLLIFPLFAGIDGIMYAGPVADLLAALVSFGFVRREFRQEKYKRTSGS